MKIKICGITNRGDAREAVRLGADMLGFVFYKRSPRYVRVKEAKAIIDGLPERVKKVGVFVNEEKRVVLDSARQCGLNMVQLHGDETPEYCAFLRERLTVAKAFRIKDEKDLAYVNTYDVDFFLLDSSVKGKKGGTGHTFDWGVAKGFKFARPVILSGGLTPKNVVRAIKKIAPYGVDVSTGVEKAPGEKDPHLMKRFIENTRKAHTG